MRSVEAARAANDAGADMIGFIFANSKRYIHPEQAALISKESRGSAKVGVFVDEEIEKVNSIAELCQLDYVQLHGHETPEYCEQIRFPIIKAFRFKDDCDCRIINQYRVNFALVDSYIPGQAGGTGVTFDWQQARQILSQIKMPVLAAGGLTIENVKDAIALLKPTGVDVSGGVETDGVKDLIKIKEFVETVRTVQRGC
ncbi:phosphoribosylanthranilate isomerase [Dendrosporobacter sp. 1207_IL3150]|uniref:phosphoribosylanthranilate isomerase n=1 Tax=Dendrosporobacter sp. 1207_IL3150 TaxID=3084054 RepID=UPI002FDA12E6